MPRHRIPGADRRVRRRRVRRLRVGYPRTTPRPEELEQTLATFREGFPDLTSGILNSCADGDMAAVHWVSRGTHEGDFMHIEPAGTQIEFEGMEFVRFEGGKIIESHVVWDAIGLLRQLGVAEPFRE